MGAVTPAAFEELKDFLQFWLDPVYAVDADFNIIWSNQAFRQAFGVRKRNKKPCFEVLRLGICNTDQCLLNARPDSRKRGRRRQAVRPAEGF